MKKVYIKSQGCQMNVYDADRLADLLQSQHMQRVDSPEEADVLLLNTCAIREKSQEKMFSQIGRWHQLQKTHPHKVIGVGGCVASQEGAALLKRAPYVDVVFGPQTLHRVPDLLRTRRNSHIAAVDVTFPEIEKFDCLPEPGVTGPEGFVSIMEGCSKYCSFCVVPYTRGDEISRPFNSVMDEVASLAARGVREIHFLGQNVNAYNTTLDDGSQADLASLLEAASAIAGVARLRYTTSHPLEMTDRLIDCYSRLPKLVSHLHLPVQSGSNAVLRAMKRDYTSDAYREILAKLRKARPGIALSSDFIVAFPGETEQDFADTLKLIDTVDFDMSFSFLYSPRPGTPAASLADTLSLQVKKQRLARLQAQLNSQAERHAQAMLGTEQSILVSDFSKRSLDSLQGRTENNRITHLNSCDPMLIGKMVRARITAVAPHSLQGAIVRVLN